MRRMILIALLSLAAVGVRAQERRFSFATTLGAGFSLSQPASTPCSWQVVGYYDLTERWALGAGTGLSFYEKTLVPLFGDVRFQIGRRRRITPYLEAAAGYSFAPQGEANGGFFLNPALGVMFGRRFQLAVGYELQEFARLKTHSDDYFRKEFAEQLSHNSLSIRVGVRF